jgi:hypothetical protein
VQPEVRPVPDGDHGEIVLWLLRRCIQQRPEPNLYLERGLGNGKYRGHLTRADRDSSA